MEALLLDLKRQYGSVYIAEMGDQVFVFREVTRQEYEEMAVFYQDNYTAEERVCYTAVLYPEDYDFANSGRAGVAHELSKEILYQSKLESPQQQYDLLDHYTQDIAQNFYSQAETYIIQAFPQISFKEMKQWTMEEFMMHLARAEWALKTIHKVDVSFERKEPEGNAAQETLSEIGRRLRQDGIDPMVELAAQIRKPKPPLPFPMIGGTNLLYNEEALAHVREQIQRIPKR